MLKVNLKITDDGKSLGGGSRSVDRAISAFVREAGKALQREVRGVLGTSEIYTLSDWYREKKLAGKTDPKMRRFAGKANDEPLILSGDMYYGVKWHREGDGAFVQVEEGRGESAAFDYAEKWEERTQFLEKGLERAEPAFEKMLADAIEKAMGI